MLNIITSKSLAFMITSEKMYSKPKDTLVTFLLPTKGYCFNYCLSRCDKNGTVSKRNIRPHWSIQHLSKTIVSGIRSTEGPCKLRECHGKLCCQYKCLAEEIEPSFGPGRPQSHHKDDWAEDRKCKPFRGRWIYSCPLEFRYIHTLVCLNVCAYNHFNYFLR